MTGAALPLLAVVAGLVSVTSPCCLPLLPAYLSFIGTGVGDSRRRRMATAGMFVAGFTTVFVAVGAGSTLVAGLLVLRLRAVTRVAGVVIVAVGLATLAGRSLPGLSREWRLPLHRMRRGPRGAFPLGMAFAAGWTPCIGPVLASVLGMAGSTGSVLAGAVLLALYSAGMGIPFVAVAAGLPAAGRTAGWLRRHGAAVERVGGGLLVAVGVGYVTGTWATLFVPLQSWYAGLGWPPI